MQSEATMQSNNNSAVSLSPSFNSYSNARLAEIAARVVEEFGSEEYYDEFYFDREDEEEQEEDSIKNCDFHGADEDEFEFAFSTRDCESFSPISADEIFCNGRIRTSYPVFNDERRNDVVPAVRLPLRELFIEERETAMTMTSPSSSSSSSSEGDELDGVPAETYCVWRPKAAAAEKSGSTGSMSKRWRFKELLSRSHSDGGKKSGFVLLGRSSSGRRKEEEKEKEKVKSAAAVAGKVKSTAAIYVGGERRRSYLPYRQDLVGLFSGVNGLSKNLKPF